MKKLGYFSIALVLCIGLLTGCGKKYKVSDDTVFVEKKGKIVATNVQDFDSSKYDEKEFKKYVDDAIDSYNEKKGEKTVSLKSIDIEDGKCTLVMKYDSYEDFAKFNGYEFFTGSVAEALAAGYTFDDIEFASIEDGKATVCNSSEFLDAKDEYQVIIMKNEAYRFDSYGKVKYVSTKNTKLVDKTVIEFALGDSLFGEQASTQADTQGKEVVSTEQATEVTVDDDEISKEGTKDTEEITFEFPQDKDSKQNNVESLGYVYIIFK